MHATHLKHGHTVGPLCGCEVSTSDGAAPVALGGRRRCACAAFFTDLGQSFLEASMLMLGTVGTYPPEMHSSVRSSLKAEQNERSSLVLRLGVQSGRAGN